MKKLYLVIFIVFASLISCSKEDQATISRERVAPQIINPTSGTSLEITADNLSDTITFTWSKAEYGVSTEITYTIQVDSTGRDFANPVSLGSTNGEALSITLESLNSTLIDDLGISVNEVSLLDIRITASINNKFKEVSALNTLTVTTYKLVQQDSPASLWLPGGYQNWIPATAPTIYAISETEFEGFVYINAGTGFKFTSHPDWDHINYGYSGTPGLLSTDGLADGLALDEAGYYKFYVNVETLAYDIFLVNSWGLIGTATPGSWDNSTPMTFDQTTGVWSKTQELGVGALKFRANNEWNLDYGPEDANLLEGNLIRTQAAISITEAGNYTITIDFSRSQAPYLYQYEVVKN